MIRIIESSPIDTSKHLNLDILKNTKNFEDIEDIIKNYTEGDTLNNQSENKLNQFIQDNTDLHFNGDIYRSIVVNHKQANYKVGGTIHHKNISSWTTSLSMIKAHEEMAYSEGRFSAHYRLNMDTFVIFRELTNSPKSAISIREISEYPGEDEVLYKGNTKFKIVSIKEEEGLLPRGRIIVDVKEIR